MSVCNMNGRIGPHRGSSSSRIQFSTELAHLSKLSHDFPDVVVRTRPPFQTTGKPSYWMFTSRLGVAMGTKFRYIKDQKSPIYSNRIKGMPSQVRRREQAKLQIKVM